MEEEDLYTALLNGSKLQIFRDKMEPVMSKIQVISGTSFLMMV